MSPLSQRALCRKHVSQVKAVSSTQHHDTSTWKVSAAPGPQEIVWGNLRSAHMHANTPCPGAVLQLPETNLILSAAGMVLSNVHVHEGLLQIMHGAPVP